MEGISVIIPCCDEPPRLLKTSVQKLKRELSGLRLDIIIVENGSSVLSEFEGARYYHIAKRGLGGALKLGIEKAKHENVFFLPADMSYDLRFVEAALAEDADMVIGSKMARGSAVGRPLERRIASRVYSLKNRLLDGIRVKDVTGVKLYKRSKILPLLNSCRSSGIYFDIELEKQAELHELRIREIPVVVRDYRRKGFLRWAT